MLLARRGLGNVLSVKCHSATARLRGRINRIHTEQIAQHAAPAPAGELDKLIQNSIRATGPISVATYMSLCLSHPTKGYYTSKPVFGSKGDFITSPEVSQVFGELLAIWFLSRWQISAPSKQIRIVELGPGRGTLLSDVIRTFCQFPHSSKALKQLRLVEMSPLLREMQSKILEQDAFKHLELDVAWFDQVEEVDADYDGYTIVIAHEFFDALPVQIFQKRDAGLHELRIDLKPFAESHEAGETATSMEEEKTLRYALDPAPTKLPLPLLLNTSEQALSSLELDTRVEFSALSYATMSQVSNLLRKSSGGGSALIIDYGKVGLEGDTFRAFRSHKQVHPLSQPGSADLTASVNFELLKAASMQSHPEILLHGPLSQGTFLDRMGLQLRLQRLLASASSEEQRKRVEDGGKRLVDVDGMGRQYSVMGVSYEPTVARAEVWPFVEMKSNSI